MVGALILWGHALAALVFGALVPLAWRRPFAGRRANAVALALTALWTLAVAGIDAADISAELAQAARSIAWLYVATTLARRHGRPARTLAALAIVVAAVLAAEAALALFAVVATGRGAADALAAARGLLGLMGTVGALMVLAHVGEVAGAQRSGATRILAVALGAMWAMDLALLAIGPVLPAAVAGLTMLRGPVMAGVGLLIAAAWADRGVGPAAMSRAMATRVITALALLVYAGLTAGAATLAAQWTSGPARAAQTVVVLTATAALLGFVSTPGLRGWLRVMAAKHLFGHRYDYRVEWQRFTATLGVPSGPASLGARIVQAVADLTDSPAGLLLTDDGETLAAAAAWRWPDGAVPVIDAAFARHLAASGRIVSLDEVRRGEAPAAEAAATPAWLAADLDAWAVVPLLHGEALAGAIVLARPPLGRALDWEDFDLLRVVGRQAASYIAEDRAHAALAEAGRFEEFNRRFAFVLHDVKNVASQLALVARNAERHADNPDFRVDMRATLHASAARLTTLLARLGQQDPAHPEASQPVDVAALLARIAAARRAQHPVRVAAGAPLLALAQPARLEQALDHLVQNAIEASRDRVPVTLAATVIGERIAITVADRGCGMDPGFVRSQLFRPFASTKPTGIGIGAFEARQLVRGMAGDLAVDSREGEGTRFTLSLPAAIFDETPLSAAIFDETPLSAAIFDETPLPAAISDETPLPVATMLESAA